MFGRDAPHSPHSEAEKDGASLHKGNQFGGLQSGSLAAVVNHYKGSVKRWCNKNRHNYFAWQPRFYEHIIRDDEDLNRIRKYIVENPLRWEVDKENAAGVWM